MGLLLMNGYNVVLMMINRLTRMRYYILYSIDENGTIAEATIYLSFNNI